MGIGERTGVGNLELREDGIMNIEQGMMKEWIADSSFVGMTRQQER
jgi:hypothetical protein